MNNLISRECYLKHSLNSRSVFSNDRNYLMHHGVKGMKWGVRHDPERIGRQRGNGESPTKKRSRKVNAKKWVKRGAMVAGAILGGVGAAYLIRSGKVDDLAKLGKNALNGVTKNMNSASKLDGKFLGALNYVQILTMNPSSDSMNCAFTSTGYIFNKITGKDVTAVPFDKNIFKGMLQDAGTPPHFFDLVFDGIKHNKTHPNPQTYFDLPSMTKACSGIKDNTHGIMFIQNGFGFGHYVNYEKANGAMRIIDCQSAMGTGKSVDTVTNWEKAGFKPIDIIDCTNATLSKDSDMFLSKILKGV